MDAFHVVCHECPEEAILADRSVAESMVDAHRDETGHRMSIGTFSAPTA